MHTVCICDDCIVFGVLGVHPAENLHIPVLFLALLKKDSLSLWLIAPVRLAVVDFSIEAPLLLYLFEGCALVSEKEIVLLALSGFGLKNG